VRHLLQFLLCAVLCAVAGTAWSDPRDAVVIAVGPWHGEGYLDVGANICPAQMDLEPQQKVWLDLTCKPTERSGAPRSCASPEHKMYLILWRKGWNLSTAAPPAVTVRVDDLELGTRTSVVRAAERLQINLGPEAVMRTALAGGRILSIDTGTEVLKYPLTDIQPLLAALDNCLVGLGTPAPPPRPPQPIEGEAPGVMGQTGPQRCDSEHDFVIYHGSWSHEPTAKQRSGMREYTQGIAPCVSVWRARCAPVPLFPYGSTDAWCEIQADYALAHLNNRREFEARGETYREFNSRADEIDRVFKEATDSFFASVQKPIDDDNARQRQDQEAKDRQAAARREQELIDTLRQLGTSRPVTTDCVGGNGSVQCTTH